MRRRSLLGLGLYVTLLTACATGHKSRVTKITQSDIPKVKITYSDIVQGEPAPTSETAPAAGFTVGVVPGEMGLPESFRACHEIT